MDYEPKALGFRGPGKTANGKISNAAYAHECARCAPVITTGFRDAIRDMVKGWEQYAAAVQARYGSKIGDDGVLGKEWAKIGDGLLGLLNGELGGFDAGSLDANIRDILRENGIAQEE